MTGLLTAAAVIATIMLLVSATHAGSTATASDPQARGSWGIASWTSQRNRALDPHERRWQTAMLSGKDNDSRWRDLVAELQELERMSDTPPAGPVPDRFNAAWLDATIANLEAASGEQ